MAHQFKAGTVEEYTEYVELWDVGSSLMHRRASTVFLEGASGVILIHDLTNRKSQMNLWDTWLPLLNSDKNSRFDVVNSPGDSFAFHSILDVESTAMPMLVVGCKLDVATEEQKKQKERTPDHINLDARQTLVAGTSQYLTAANFFDKVIKKTTPGTHERRRKLL
ncbi:hypothetical protein L596_027494 [Steinernema carpocapsae]|uniref:Uncharacterized protein n=1 Tax=Steinernema carpocapsae TaxID=34508 RepID=A0A4U5LVN2_STECR|nr:hypothetical protein L596_027494 [Steinernema carpocapsae]